MSEGPTETASAPAEATPERRWRRTLASVAVVVLICLGVVVTRAVWEGRAALHAGDRALREGALEEAIRSWRRAARWYVPAAPHVGDALDRLEALGHEAEERGDLDTALAAWRGVRSSILATRSFYVPHDERLEPAASRIAALMARQEAGARAATDATAAGAAIAEDERRQWHYQLLMRDEAPSVPWAVLALIGFGIWLGGGFLFALRGVTAHDRLVPRTAAIAGAMVVVGLLIWMLGLYKA